MSGRTEGYGKQWSEDYQRGYTRGCDSRDAEITALKARVEKAEAALIRISLLSENQQAGQIALEALR